jgi:hypothetical protein
MGSASDSTQIENLGWLECVFSINPLLWQEEEVPSIRIGNRRRDLRFMITTSESKSVDILRSDDEKSIEPKKS